MEIAHSVSEETEGGLMLTVAVFVIPPQTAVMVTRVFEVTGCPVIVNVFVVEPLAVTLAGTRGRRVRTRQIN